MTEGITELLSVGQKWEVAGHQLLLRVATACDGEEIQGCLGEIIREKVYLKEAPELVPPLEEVRKEITHIQEEGGLYIVVEVDHQIRGALLMRRGLQGTSDHTVKLRTWLTSQCRGFGLGTKLMEYGLLWATERPDIEKINLDVWANNERAVQLYEKLGFQVEGRRKREAYLEGEYVDELYMGKFV